MKVSELIEILQKVENKDVEIVTEVGDNNGCSTCGYGETTTRTELQEANDLETRVVLVFG